MPASVADVFRDEVRPILLRQCTPCHEPGGQMYERMPFDDPAVVASHPEGVLKRLKDERDKALVEAWIRSRTGS